MPLSKHPEPYIVRKNDNLWSIAQSLYGMGLRWREIAAMNAIDDPTQLRTGTLLSVPTDQLLHHPRPYTIKKHDTYFKLASDHLGNFTRWPDIAKLNTVGPTQLRTGMNVNVPLDFRHP